MVEGRGLVLVIVRGDHRVNEIKLQNALGAEFRPAREDEFAERIGPAGYIGPVGADVPILLDDAVEPGGYVTGANRDNAHLRGVEPGRDFPFKRADVRTRRGRRHRRRAADPDRAGDRGRQHLQARHALLRAARRDLPRRVAARRGRSGWAPTGSARRASPPPRSSSTPTSRASRGRARCRRSTSSSSASGARAPRSASSPSGSTASCSETGLDVVYDDRDAGPGEKFADAELLGVPLRLTVGKRTLAAGEVEAQVRRGRESRSLPLEGAAAGGGGAVAQPPVNDDAGRRHTPARPARTPSPTRRRPRRRRG